MLSEVEAFHFKGKNFFVKRDDLIDPLLSGNKYRKLYSLIQTPAEKYKTIISYGGTQSNAMLSIAALCQQKGWGFEYYCKPIAQHLKEKPTGNLAHALQLGMKLIEVDHDKYEHAIAGLKTQESAQTLLLKQGGADPLAELGIQQLAAEIAAWQQQEHLKTLNIITPSGTGTTAYYLAKSLPQAHVFTTASVGDNAYLLQQMSALGDIPSNLTLLEPSRKYHFAKPYPEFLNIYEELKKAGISFDLIYAPKMWLTLFARMQNIQGTLLYVHSGGLLGNETMLERYAHKGVHHV